MMKVAMVVFVISVVAAFVCLTVNVDTKDIGGITGTIVVQPGTAKEHVDQTRSALRIAGLAWICIGTVALVWAMRRAAS